MKILIIDADKHTRNVLSRFLRHSGMDIAAVSNATAALKRLRTGKTYDCLIMDVLLPDMPGRELVQLLSNEHLCPPERILLLTSVHNADNATAYMQYGCAGYCGKPFENQTILDQVQRACGRTPPNTQLNAIV